MMVKFLPIVTFKLLQSKIEVPFNEKSFNTTRGWVAMAGTVRPEAFPAYACKEAVLAFALLIFRS